MKPRGALSSWGGRLEAQAGVKVRQPLPKAVIDTDREREQIERLEGLVAGELNVKRIEYVAEETELVPLR